MSRVSQVEFCRKEGKYRKIEDTDVFYLKKNREKNFKIFRPIRELEIKNSWRISNWCSLEAAWPTEFKTGLRSIIDPILESSEIVVHENLLNEVTTATRV